MLYMFYMVKSKIRVHRFVSDNGIDDYLAVVSVQNMEHMVRWLFAPI